MSAIGRMGRTLRHSEEGSLTADMIVRSEPHPDRSYYHLFWVASERALAPRRQDVLFVFPYGNVTVRMHKFSHGQ